MARRRYEGSKLQFVERHLHLSNAEIFALSQKMHIGIKRRAYVAAMRSKLKSRAIVSATVPQAAAAVPSEMHPKEAQLRKLIFELGFDVVQRVFLEFQDMHSRMR